VARYELRLRSGPGPGEIADALMLRTELLRDGIPMQPLHLFVNGIDWRVKHPDLLLRPGFWPAVATVAIEHWIKGLVRDDVITPDGPLTVMYIPIRVKHVRKLLDEHETWPPLVPGAMLGSWTM
jgi:hypothetical protein